MRGNAADRGFLLLAGVGALAIFSSTLSKTPTLPLFAESLGGNSAEIGWIVAAATIPGVLFSLPVGILVDRLGPGRLLRLSLLVFVTAPWLYLFVDTLGQLAVVRFYHGFATAVFGTAAAAMIAESYPKQRALRFSLFSTATVVGRSAAPFAGGALISMAGFDTVFIACAVAAALAWLGGLGFSRDSTSAAADSAPRLRASPFNAFGNAAILTVAFADASQFFVFGAVEAFLPIYAVSIGIEPWAVGIVLGAQLLMVVTMKPLLGRLSDRHGRARVIGGGLIIGCIAVFVIPFASTVWLLTVASCLVGLGLAAVSSSTAATVADLSEQGSLGASIGALRALADLGQAAGPVAVGATVHAFGFTAGFSLAGGVLGLAFLLYVARFGIK